MTIFFSFVTSFSLLLSQILFLQETLRNVLRGTKNHIKKESFCHNGDFQTLNIRYLISLVYSYVCVNTCTSHLIDMYNCLPNWEISCWINMPVPYTCTCGCEYLYIELIQLMFKPSIRYIKIKQALMNRYIYIYIYKCCFTQERKAKLHFKIYLCTANCFV